MSNIKYVLMDEGSVDGPITTDTAESYVFYDPDGYYSEYIVSLDKARLFNTVEEAFKFKNAFIKEIKSEIPKENYNWIHVTVSPVVVSDNGIRRLLIDDNDNDDNIIESLNNKKLTPYKHYLYDELEYVGYVEEEELKEFIKKHNYKIEWHMYLSDLMDGEKLIAHVEFSKHYRTHEDTYTICKLTIQKPYLNRFKELFPHSDVFEDTIIEKIVKKGNQWQVQSEKGRNMGTYNNKEEAKKRLQQIEYFKHKNEDLEEDLKDKAKEIFGTTFDWRKALYINTDGTLLDGSGKKLGSDGSSRTVDHREVCDVFKDDNVSISGDDAMIAYMLEGNIRWKPEAPGFEMIIEPNEIQYEVLRKLIPHLDFDTYYVDITSFSGIPLKQFTYQYPTQKTLNDIKNYFHKLDDVTIGEKLIQNGNNKYIITSPLIDTKRKFEKYCDGKGFEYKFFPKTREGTYDNYIVYLPPVKNDDSEFPYRESIAIYNSEKNYLKCVYNRHLKYFNDLIDNDVIGEQLELNKIEGTSNPYFKYKSTNQESPDKDKKYRWTLRQPGVFNIWSKSMNIHDSKDYYIGRYDFNTKTLYFNDLRYFPEVEVEDVVIGEDLKNSKFKLNKLPDEYCSDKNYEVWIDWEDLRKLIIDNDYRVQDYFHTRKDKSGKYIYKTYTIEELDNMFTTHKYYSLKMINKNDEYESIASLNIGSGNSGQCQLFIRDDKLIYFKSLLPNYLDDETIGEALEDKAFNSEKDIEEFNDYELKLGNFMGQELTYILINNEDCAWNIAMNLTQDDDHPLFKYIEREVKRTDFKYALGNGVDYLTYETLESIKTDEDAKKFISHFDLSNYYMLFKNIQELNNFFDRHKELKDRALKLHNEVIGEKLKTKLYDTYVIQTETIKTLKDLIKYCKSKDDKLIVTFYNDSSSGIIFNLYDKSSSSTSGKKAYYIQKEKPDGKGYKVLGIWQEDGLLVLFSKEGLDYFKEFIEDDLKDDTIGESINIDYYPDEPQLDYIEIKTHETKTRQSMQEYCKSKGIRFMYSYPNTRYDETADIRRSDGLIIGFWGREYNEDGVLKVYRKNLNYFNDLTPELEDTVIGESLESNFKLNTCGYIRPDGSIITLKEYHGEDENTKDLKYVEFSNTHPEDDTCIRIYKKPTEKQYSTIKYIIDKYLDTEGYCKVELWNEDGKSYHYYKVFSLFEDACQDFTQEEVVGNWTGEKLVKIIKDYFSNSLQEEYKYIFDTIWVYVSNTYDGGGWDTEIPVINNSINDSIKAYRKTLGRGYWVSYTGPGKKHLNTSKQKEEEKKDNIQRISIFDDLD